MEFGRVVVWWLLYQGLLVAGWPLAAAIAPSSRNRGAWMAIPVAIVALLLPVFWIGQVAYGLPTILVGVLSTVALSVSVARWRDFEYDWASVREVVVVFTLAFVFMLTVRAAAPGIYPGGGEKFLDFGILQSLLRADSLPPEDMWFAGETLLYYYGGHLVSATLATITGTAGKFAFPLALSGFYAMELTAVYGLASSIAADRSLSPVAAGGFAAFVWGFASNLLTPARLLANLLPTSAREEIARIVADRTGGVYTIDPADVAVTPRTFDYWTASRIIPDTINEFPLFVFRNGELHPHVMSVAFMLTATGVLYGYYRTPADRRWRRRALLLGVLPPVVGTILFVNTWSFPTVLGLAVLSVAAAPAGPRTLLSGGNTGSAGSVRHRIVEEIRRPVVAALLAGGVGSLAAVLVWPFVSNVLVQSGSTQHVALFPDRTGLGPFLVVHGAFLVTFALYLGARLTGGPRTTGAMVALVPVTTYVGWRFDLVGAALVGPLVLAGWYLVRRDRLGYEGVLLVAGAGLVVLVEFAYLAENASPGRFNTVFKTYAQVWIFWSIAAGVALASLVRRAPTTLPMSAVGRRRAGRVFAAALVVSLSLYGAMALANHYGSATESSLNGYDYLEKYHPEEAGAVRWVNDLAGQPTLVSAPGLTPYTWENPASSLTGVPTVAGWAHERIYRGDEAYNRRVRDVEILFETEEAASRAALLRLYEVDYIYYGPREKARYGEHDYASEPGISVAYRRPSGNVTIYRVDRDALVG
ncbi:MAG: DUF2298 domain-containing protein [Halanaeroarchaeum sp.]